MGYLSPFFQFDKDICTTCVYNLYIRAILLDIVSSLQRDFKSDVFLLTFLANCARVSTAMARVKDDSSEFFSLSEHSVQHNK